MMTLTQVKQYVLILAKGIQKKFRQNVGKQCVVMYLTAIIYNEIRNINAWDSSFLNVILCIGNSLYTCISNSINKTFLLLTDVPEIV